jgi:hypothetical protein
VSALIEYAAEDTKTRLFQPPSAAPADEAASR